MRELSISEIHEAILKTFEELELIFNKLNINYFIAYGTLIGAVRHKGFIPWDDDFDVILLRPDFDKFVDYCHKNINNTMSKYKLMDYTNTINYPFTIPRFCNLNYEMISDDYKDINMGIFIDIYPYDGLGNSKKKAIKKLTVQKKFYMIALSSVIKKKVSYDGKNILKLCLSYFIFLYAKNKSSIYFIDKLIQLKDKFKLDDSKYIGCVVWDFDLVPKEKKWFLDIDYLEFEGHKVKVPIGYDEVLKESYGNYMKLPPINEQKASHNYRIYSKENS